MTDALFITGAGGVGKTTVSASLAVKAANSGIRTLVLTVDPAKRLAGALGLADLGSEPQPHPDEPNLWGCNARRNAVMAVGSGASCRS